MRDTEMLIAAAQEREVGVDHGRTFSGQIVETQAVIIVEEAGHGLQRHLAGVGVGAEGEPLFGHTLEAAQRPAGHA